MLSFTIFPIDVNECELNNGDCEYKCSNEPGGYSCTCPIGFQLTPDERNCTGKYKRFNVLFDATALE